VRRSVCTRARERTRRLHAHAYTRRLRTRDTASPGTSLQTTEQWRCSYGLKATVCYRAITRTGANHANATQ